MYSELINLSPGDLHIYIPVYCAVFIKQNYKLIKLKKIRKSGKQLQNRYSTIKSENHYFSSVVVVPNTSLWSTSVPVAVAVPADVAFRVENCHL